MTLVYSRTLNLRQGVNLAVERMHKDQIQVLAVAQMLAQAQDLKERERGVVGLCSLPQ